METANILLFYIVSLAGLFMIVGGMWLVYKQKIYLDPTNGKSTAEVELPWGVKLKTSSAALAFFALGFVPLIYGPVKAADVSRLRASLPKEVTLRGKVNTHPISQVNVYAVVGEHTLHEPGEFALRVTLPKERTEDCRILYLVENGTVFDSPFLDPKNIIDDVFWLPDKDLEIARALRNRSAMEEEHDLPASPPGY